MFIGTYFLLSAFGASSFSQTPITEITVFQSLLLVVLFVACLSTIAIACLLAALSWSKLASYKLDSQHRAYIFHRLYRTPQSGWVYKQNTRYVNWLIKIT
jgi:hypothetical protein